MNLDDRVKEASLKASRIVLELLESLERRADENAKRIAKANNISTNQVLRYLELFGSMDEVLSMLSVREGQLMKTIRVNTVKTTRNHVMKRLSEKGFKVRPYEPTPYGVVVDYEPLPIGATHEYMLGYYTVQGPASMLVVLALNPSNANAVLDCCSGAGGKATQAAQHTRAPIIAVDANARKLLALKNNVSRLGIYNVIALKGDARLLPTILKGVSFSHIIVDAPCTGEGLLPFSKGRWPRSPRDVASRVKLQVELLASMLAMLEEGGKLAYATCSISVEENEYVVSQILELFPTVKLVDPPIPGDHGVTNYLNLDLADDVRKCKRLYPHRHHTEGFTICILTA